MKTGQNQFEIYDFMVSTDILNYFCLYPTMDNFIIEWVGYYKKASPHFVKRISPKFYNFIYCMDGRGYIVNEKQEEIVINPGNFFICLPNLTHHYYSDKMNPWTITWFHFTMPNFQEIALQTNLPSLQDHIIGYAGLESHVSMMIIESIRILKHDSSVNSIHVANQFCKSALFRCLYFLNYKPDEHSNKTIEKLINFIQQNSNKKITLNLLAELGCMSIPTLSLQFRKTTGLAPIDFVLHERVSKACTLLRETSLSLKEISRQIGYEDVYYFSRLFKKFTNLSPSKWRIDQNRKMKKSLYPSTNKNLDVEPYEI